MFNTTKHYSPNYQSLLLSGGFLLNTKYFNPSPGEISDRWHGDPSFFEDIVTTHLASDTRSLPLYLESQRESVTLRREENLRL